MKKIYIEGMRTEYFVPTVSLDPQIGKCLLAGESYLEDTVKFYEPILNWFTEYTQKVQKPIHLDIRLTYFNTSSSRSLLDIFYILKEYREEGGVVQVDWHIKPTDNELREEIEDYILDTELDINIIVSDTTSLKF